MKDKILYDQFKKEHPETVGETDKEFDEYNYREWLEKKVTHLYSAGEEVYVGCPECGAEIRYGLSSEALDKLKQSKLLTRPTVSEEVRLYDIEMIIRKYHCDDEIKTSVKSAWDIRNLFKSSIRQVSEEDVREIESIICNTTGHVEAAKAIKELLNR